MASALADVKAAPLPMLSTGSAGASVSAGASATASAGAGAGAGAGVGAGVGPDTGAETALTEEHKDALRIMGRLGAYFEPDVMRAVMRTAIAVDAVATAAAANTAAALARGDTRAADAIARALHDAMEAPSRWYDADVSEWCREATEHADPALLLPPALWSDQTGHMYGERRPEVLRWVVRWFAALRVVGVPPDALLNVTARDGRPLQPPPADRTRLRLNEVNGYDGNGEFDPPLTRAVCMCPDLAHALLDLPPCYGLDVNLIGTDGRAAVAWSVVRWKSDPALARRLLLASSDAALNATGDGRHPPVLHELIKAMWSRGADVDDDLVADGIAADADSTSFGVGSGYSLADEPEQRRPLSVIVALIDDCCSDAVSRLDGSGLDLFAPDVSRSRDGGHTKAHIGTAQVLGALQPLSAAPDTATAARAARCAVWNRAVQHVRDTVSGALARVEAYARDFPVALAQAQAMLTADTSVASVALPPPLQTIVCAYALHRPAPTPPSTAIASASASTSAAH